MPSFRQSNFASGEISPYLYGRTDLQRYNAGLRTCLNFIPVPQGPLVNRPGFQFVAETKGSGAVRLVPFQFSNSSSFVLEFGNLYIRFYTNGAVVINPGTGLPYEITTPYLTAELDKLKFAQVGDEITIAHSAHPPQTLRRITNSPPLWTLGATSVSRPANTWMLNAYEGLPVRVWDAHIRYDAGMAIAGTNSHYYRAMHDGILGGMSPESGGDGNWLDIGSTFSVDTYGGASRPPKAWAWVITSVDHNGVESFPTSPALSFPAIVLYSDRPIIIQWIIGATPGSTAYYNVYRGRNGVFGYVGQALITRLAGIFVGEFRDDGAGPDYSLQPPKATDPFTLANNPAVVTHFEQRRVFGNTINSAQKMNLSRTGAFYNFDFSDPPRDSDAIELTLASEIYEEIRWIISMRSLLVGTSSGEWSVSGNGGPISPVSIDAKVQSRHGSSWISPIVIGNSVVFVKEKGNSVRNLVYDRNSETYAGNDLSLLASHLFLDHSIVDWAFQSVPNSIIWSAREDGTLLGLTFLQEQEVLAWHRHTTDGSVERVCSVSETTEDFLYLVVRRVINGTTRRYVERMATRRVTDITRGSFLDSYAIYPGPASTSTITELGYLEGKVVYALADGFVQGPFTVSGGAITLNSPATYAIVGLPYVSEAEQLDLTVQGQEIRDRYRTVTKVAVEASESQSLWMGETRSKMSQWSFQNVNDSYGPASLIEPSHFEIIISNLWNKNGRVIIQQRLPLPVTIHSITREVEFGGT